MSRKADALESIERALKELKAPADPMPIDFDPVLSTVEKLVIVVGVGALVIIAGALTELVILQKDPDNSAVAEAFGHGGRDTKTYTN